MLSMPHHVRRDFLQRKAARSRTGAKLHAGFVGIMLQMNAIPTLSVNEHRRFTPEMRDRVVDKLRQYGQASADPTYRMLTPYHLRQLAELR